MDDDIIKRLQAERVDIVEPDGTLRMSLRSSKHTSPAPADGAEITSAVKDNGGASGIRFYNNEGDECGGLSFSGGKTEDGYSSSLSLTFDQYKNDYVLQTSLSEQNGKRQYGYTIYDRQDNRPSKSAETRDEENVQRMFLGKEEGGAVSVRVNDSKGRERIRLRLNAEGEPEICVLDENGNVIADLAKID